MYPTRFPVGGGWLQAQVGRGELQKWPRAGYEKGLRAFWPRAGLVTHGPDLDTMVTVRQRPLARYQSSLEEKALFHWHHHSSFKLQGRPFLSTLNGKAGKARNILIDPHFHSCLCLHLFLALFQICTCVACLSSEISQGVPSLSILRGRPCFSYKAACREDSDTSAGHR